MNTGPVHLHPAVLLDPGRLRRHLSMFHSLYVAPSAGIEELLQAHQAVQLHPVALGDGEVPHVHDTRTPDLDPDGHGFW